MKKTNFLWHVITMLFLDKKNLEVEFSTLSPRVMTCGQCCGRCGGPVSLSVRHPFVIDITSMASCQPGWVQGRIAWICVVCGLWTRRALLLATMMSTSLPSSTSQWSHLSTAGWCHWRRWYAAAECPTRGLMTSVRDVARKNCRWLFTAHRTHVEIVHWATILSSSDSPEACRFLAWIDWQTQVITASRLAVAHHKQPRLTSSSQSFTNSLLTRSLAYECRPTTQPVLFTGQHRIQR